MKFQFTGDFAKLAKFTGRVARAPSVLATVNEQLAEETIDLIRQGFEDATDPYGKPWDRLKLRSGRPLQDTGGLKASWHRKYATREGFGVANGKAYAKFHQGGTGLYGPSRSRIYPKSKKALRLKGGLFFRSVKGTKARKMVPENGVIPPLWMRRFIDTAHEVLTDHFTG